jgi:hypothetical protein
VCGLPAPVAGKVKCLALSGPENLPEPRLNLTPTCNRISCCANDRAILGKKGGRIPMITREIRRGVGHPKDSGAKGCHHKPAAARAILKE